MRKFDTGATRDSDDGKYDYEAFFSPITLECCAEYMHKHRIQADGSLRDGDNWQNHFGSDHFNVCIKSLFRHFIDFWFLHRGYKRFDKKDGHEITKKEALCAMIFNEFAYLDKLLKDELKKEQK